MQRTRLVVMDNHTLGYILPGSDYVGVLHSSVLRGGGYSGCIHQKGHLIRTATPQDFEDFRVSFDGFDNTEEYEFETVNLPKSL